MRRCGSDHNRVLARADRIEAGNNLEINQVPIAQGAMLHGQEQFRPTRVDARLLPVMRQHLRGLRCAAGLVDFETRERGHGLRPPGCSSGLEARLFFSCKALQTRSGVNGSRLIRTPAAWYNAFAKQGEMGFRAPSPPPLAP